MSYGSNLVRFEQDVVCANADESVVEVARLMRQRRVGCVVVVREGRPYGIVTDRDLTLRVIAEKRDPATLTARDVMTYDPACLDRAASIESAARIMRERRVRRVPIIDAAGSVVGIVTSDDLLSLFAREIADTSESLLDGVDANESR